MLRNMDMEKIQTGISGAYWCVPRNGLDESAATQDTYSFEKAYLGPEMTRSKNISHTSWLDELFDGGIVVPKTAAPGVANNVMTIMVSGPPGTGKSTFALELCYRLATNNLNSKPLRSLYLTTEGHPPWLIEHARDGFGWDPSAVALGEENPNFPVDVRPFKTTEDIERLEAPHVSTGTGNLQTQSLFQKIEHFFGTSPAANIARRTTNIQPVDWEYRDMVVFDNLNTIQIPEREWVEFLSQLGAKGPRIALIILDSSTGTETAMRWEYLSDVVIRLKREYPDGYMIRTIEIIKARYQHHVFGPQQLKLLQSSTNRSIVPMREHPFREEGGVFVFPSMHFVLSRHNYVAGRTDDESLPTPWGYLNDLLGGKGFPSGRCVALTGQRGTHKSRLAYAQLLYTLKRNKASKGLLISLGDDEETTKSILDNIDNGYLGQTPQDSTVSSLLREGRLEIAYYPPGFITPYEFFHRVLLSVARLRTGDTKEPVLLVFSSLEILASHFPLCAQHGIFIPALIELLGYRGVTSFFVATSEENAQRHAQPVDNSGLLSMADPILSFERMTTFEEMEFPWLDPKSVGLALGESIVRMRVERFAAGTSAGSEADVLLLRKNDPLAVAVGQPQGGLFVGKPGRRRGSL